MQAVVIALKAEAVNNRVKVRNALAKKAQF